MSMFLAAESDICIFAGVANFCALTIYLAAEADIDQ